MQVPALSVIVPTLNEHGNLARLGAELLGIAIPHELVVADGGSTDGTCELAVQLGATLAPSRPGRGTQLRAGVSRARGEWLMVLHADASLDAAALAQARHFLAANRPDRFAVWPLRFSAPGAWLRVVERGAALRGRMFGLPYGDQGLLVHCSLYELAGGYPDIPLMEDVALVRALRRVGTLTWLGAPIRASARRYQREGQVRRTFLNLGLVSLFAAGVSPDRLVRWYRPETAR